MLKGQEEFESIFGTIVFVFVIVLVTTTLASRYVNVNVFWARASGEIQAIEFAHIVKGTLENDEGVIPSTMLDAYSGKSLKELFGLAEVYTTVELLSTKESWSFPGAGGDYEHDVYVTIQKDDKLLPGKIHVEISGAKNLVTAKTGQYAGAVDATQFISGDELKQVVSHSSARGETAVDYIVLHHTAGDTVEGALGAWVNAKASAHYIVGKDGTVVSVIPEHMSAWHANCMNSRSIGIEIVNRGDGKDPYPEAQIKALKDLLRYLIDKYGIRDGGVIGHGCTNSGKHNDEPTGLAQDFMEGVRVYKYAPGCGALCCNFLC